MDLQKILDRNRQKMGLNKIEIRYIDPEYYFNMLSPDIKSIIIDGEYNLLKKPLIQHSLDNSGTILFYSGGLESSVCSISIAGKFKIYVVNNLYEFCHSKGILITESFLMAITAIMNEGTAIIGSEYTPEGSITNKNYEYSNDFIEKFSNALNITVYSPVSWIDKFNLFKQAISRNIEFKSCNQDIVCGNCFKCFQISTFQRAIYTSNPIEVNKEKVIKYINEHNQYLIDNIDTYDDDFSFTQIGKSLEEIWNVI